MLDINYILDLLDWNKSADDQSRGIKLANEIKNITFLLQPCDEKHNKNVWDNCAVVISCKSDDELEPYLIELLEWIQDLNWPGAKCIFERISKYHISKSFNTALSICLKRAVESQDDIWLNNLLSIKYISKKKNNNPN